MSCEPRINASLKINYNMTMTLFDIPFGGEEKKNVALNKVLQSVNIFSMNKRFMTKS